MGVVIVADDYGALVNETKLWQTGKRAVGFGVGPRR